MGITGSVENNNQGVIIKIRAGDDDLSSFIRCLKDEAPPVSRIENITVETCDLELPHGFHIISSSSHSAEVTEVSPDIAVCSDCLEDMKQQPHRIAYPFINCTNCGPRFTIIRDLPYDRALTTMQPFIMCDTCRAEYSDIADRRFHAQPVACLHCGPSYTLHTENIIKTEIHDIIEYASGILKKGKVIAVKGMGGYFLMCNALDAEACGRLREIKKRESKPFALMFRDLETLRLYASAGEREAGALTSFRRPVVLLKQTREMPREINGQLGRIGCMLPYMPVHYMLFEQCGMDALVMTSGNFSDAPILISDQEAHTVFAASGTPVISYNREIYNRCDDSVMMLVNNKARLIRRSRGFVPQPLRLSMKTEGILACGAGLKNTFCIGKGEQAIMSQHIGDLDNAATYEFYTESVARFSKLFRMTPDRVVCDLHPDYLSSRFAAESGLPMIQVQHHHAHIASVMAEHGVTEPLIGVSFDGTGLGDDGAIWGGEFMICDLRSYRRVNHLKYLPMPGGDLAATQSWRMAVSCLYEAFGPAFTGFDLPFLRAVDPQKVRMLIQGIESRLNCPPTSSAGRLFDAVSALTGVCLHHAYEAEGPMLMEALADPHCRDSYPYVNDTDGISMLPAIRAIVDDLLHAVPVGIISAKFHHTLVRMITEQCVLLRDESGIRTVALSGGVFQNALLLESLENGLESSGFTVLTNLAVPSNDGGIALGQLAVAAARS